MNIVMPVYNRPKHTKQAIESLYKNSRFEVNLTVVDDNSNEETKDLLQRLSEQFGFKLLRNRENNGPGYSRNKACQEITKKGKRGRYLYFSDNDVYFTKSWDFILKTAYYEVSKKRVALLGGSCHPYLKSYEIINVKNYRVGIKDAVSGYSQFITWEIWDRFGPFDTQEGLEKKTGRSDDWMLCQKIKADGLEVGSIEPQVIIPTGKTDSYGDEAVGTETFQEHEGIMIA